MAITAQFHPELGLRERYSERRGMTQFRLNRYLTSMVLDNPFRDGQPEADAFRLRSKERIENAWQDYGRDACTGIGDADSNCLIPHIDVDSQLAFFFHGIE